MSDRTETIIQDIGKFAFFSPQNYVLEQRWKSGEITESEYDALSDALDDQWDAMTVDEKAPWLRVGSDILDLQEDDQRMGFVLLQDDEALAIQDAVEDVQEALRALPSWVLDTVVKNR